MYTLVSLADVLFEFGRATRAANTYEPTSTLEHVKNIPILIRMKYLDFAANPRLYVIEKTAIIRMLVCERVAVEYFTSLAVFFHSQLCRYRASVSATKPRKNSSHGNSLTANGARQSSTSRGFFERYQ
jgi:hypothetical protein